MRRRRPHGGHRAAAATASVVTGASLTAEEVCAASGLSAEEVAGLEWFGLIEPVKVAGIATYDEDALTLANLAAHSGPTGSSRATCGSTATRWTGSWA